MRRHPHAWKYKQDRRRTTVTVTCPVCSHQTKTRAYAEWCTGGPRSADHNAIWYRFPAEAEVDVVRIRHSSPEPDNVVALADQSCEGAWRVTFEDLPEITRDAMLKESENDSH